MTRPTQVVIQTQIIVHGVSDEDKKIELLKAAVTSFNDRTVTAYVSDGDDDDDEESSGTKMKVQMGGGR